MLPATHCELDANELILAFVKKITKTVRENVAPEKVSCIEVIKDLCQENLRSVTSELWKKCIKLFLTIEDNY